MEGEDERAAAAGRGVGDGRGEDADFDRGAVADGDLVFDFADLGGDGAWDGVEVAESGEVVGAVVPDVQAWWCCWVGFGEVREWRGGLGLCVGLVDLLMGRKGSR